MIRLFLSAGMPRSGSTWFYNAARLILCSHPAIRDRFSGGWIGDIARLPRQPYMLIKLHEFTPQLVSQAQCVLYSFRDPRDVLASAARMFGRPASLADAEHLLAQDALWRQHARLCLCYETMLAEPRATVAAMAAALEIEGIDPQALVTELADMSHQSPGGVANQPHPVNLYHRDHITDGRHGSWQDLVPASLAETLVERHRDWFVTHGYET